MGKLLRAAGLSRSTLLADVRALELMVSTGVMESGRCRIRCEQEMFLRGNDTLTVNSKIARWFVVEIFHLLGFRRQRPENGIQVFTRRRETP